MPDDSGRPASYLLRSGLVVKAASACVGALATNIVATPLDVVKVRLQAAVNNSGSGAAGGGGGAQGACGACGHFKHTNGGILERIMCTMQRRNITSPLSLFTSSTSSAARTSSAPAIGSVPASAAAAATTSGTASRRARSFLMALKKVQY